MDGCLTAHLLLVAVVTQLGECKTEDLEVAGSSPAHGIISHDLTGRSDEDRLKPHDALRAVWRDA
jgi:hypothetical protein